MSSKQPGIACGRLAGKGDPYDRVGKLVKRLSTTFAATLLLSACGPVDAASTATPAASSADTAIPAPSMLATPAPAATSTPAPSATLVAAAATAPATSSAAAAPAAPAAVAPETGAALTLPGGASSLTEAHQDWTVNCAIIDRAGQKAKQCTFSQQQLNNDTKQRIIAIELVPTATGASGVLDLAFGLALQNGVTLQVDTGAPLPPLSFRTCLPAGCLVNLTVDGKLLTALRAGTALKIAATADGGQPVQFTVSLKGFGSALDRTAELLQ